jgi:hypothetical protein
MTPMIVLTTKMNGGTQDVQGFYRLDQLGDVLDETRAFFKRAGTSPRAIARIELYNPPEDDIDHQIQAWENEGGR